MRCTAYLQNAALKSVLSSPCDRRWGRAVRRPISSRSKTQVRQITNKTSKRHIRIAIKFLCLSFLLFFAEEALVDVLRVHLSRLIAYAESADLYLQREVAEKLANEAVKRAFKEN